jgi:hypothetical protein
MSWHWVADRSPDSDVGLGKKFPTQGEAETWLGEFYPDLLDSGVATVTLFEEDRLVYGPMRLDAEVT